jgi:hypothetical protein
MRAMFSPCFGESTTQDYVIHLGCVQASPAHQIAGPPQPAYPGAPTPTRPVSPFPPAPRGDDDGVAEELLLIIALFLAYLYTY